MYRPLSSWSSHYNSLQYNHEYSCTNYNLLNTYNFATLWSAVYSVIVQYSRNSYVRRRPIYTIMELSICTACVLGLIAILQPCSCCKVYVVQRCTRGPLHAQPQPGNPDSSAIEDVWITSWVMDQDDSRPLVAVYSRRLQWLATAAKSVAAS